MKKKNKKMAFTRSSAEEEFKNTVVTQFNRIQVMNKLLKATKA